MSRVCVFLYSLAFCTSSSFHHQDSLSTYLPQDVYPNISFALVLIMLHISSHVVSSSSFLLPISSASLRDSSSFFSCCFRKYSITPLIRPPSESHWCGCIRGMVVCGELDYYALYNMCTPEHTHTTMHNSIIHTANGFRGVPVASRCRPRVTQRPIHYNVLRHVRTLAV